MGFIYFFELPIVLNQISTSKLKITAEGNDTGLNMRLFLFDLDLPGQRKQIFQAERFEKPVIKLGCRAIGQGGEEEKFILRSRLLDAAVEPAPIGVADSAETEA